MKTLPEFLEHFQKEGYGIDINNFEHKIGAMIVNEAISILNSVKLNIVKTEDAVCKYFGKYFDHKNCICQATSQLPEIETAEEILENIEQEIALINSNVSSLLSLLKQP